MLIDSPTTVESQGSSRGVPFYFAGWAIFILSAVSALMNMSADPQFVVPFWFSIGILVLVSLIYCICCMVSQKWRTRIIRTYLSPYLLGSVGWLALFLAFWLIDRFAG